MLFGSSTRERHARRISTDVQRITLNASCMMISGGRTKQLIIILQVFCRITGFTSDCLNFILVEHIRLFHGALQLKLIIIFCFQSSLKSATGCRVADSARCMMLCAHCMYHSTMQLRELSAND